METEIPIPQYRDSRNDQRKKIILCETLIKISAQVVPADTLVGTVKQRLLMRGVRQPQ